MYIAMWSGPRNISTALLRSFGARTDCAVVDEPMYAAYLTRTGKDHPGREDILASQAVDYATLASQLTGPIPGGRQIYYQKHMAHHLLPEANGDWLNALTHVFLIRDPAEMLSSLLKVWPDAELEDTGLPQQVALFDRICAQSGGVPPVLDGRQVMDDPEGSLRLLCGAVGVPFDPAMLSWAQGPRDTDGVWGTIWYANVWRSERFVRWRARDTQIPPGKSDLLTNARRLYDHLKPHCLRSEA
jgi:hypothetical protein